MTASRTRLRGTLLAMRRVLSSTAASSTEWPSVNARSRDWRASERNSVSVVVGVIRVEGREVREAEAEAEAEIVESPRDLRFRCETEENSSEESSEEDSEDVMEPGSDREREEAESALDLYLEL